MNKTRLWPQVYEAMHAVGAHYGPAVDKVSKMAGLDPAASNMLIVAQMYDPHPVAAWRLRERSPYTASRRYDERLQVAARLGFLKAVHEGEYRLTELGHRTVRQIVDASYKALGKLTPLPPADMERLAALLHRLVGASLAAPEPPAKLCLNLSRRMVPVAPVKPLIMIDQYFGDLNSYRDDAHMAAWGPTELSAAAWETLTYLWRGEAKTIDELMNKLERRGHIREDYEEALNDLVQRNLAREETGIYLVTPPGKELRQQVEDKTDRLFYAPWAKLTGGEHEELRGLVERLHDGMAKPKARVTPHHEVEAISGY